MKRAARFDNEEIKKAIAQVDTTTTRPIRFMKNYNNRSVTENGATGYKTTLHPLLDMNFKVSSLRNRGEAEIIENFIKAYYDDRIHSVKWLFFLRDILEGMGERRSFRICLKYLIFSHPDVALAVMPLVPEYGRYDDLLVYVDSPLCRNVCKLLKRQLQEDLKAMEEKKAVSLLAKWLPSNNTSSKEARRLARILAKNFGMSEREYRKTLSALRRYSEVVEIKLSASKWAEVDYEKVPAKANLKYDQAFAKHDRERRADYLRNAFLGNNKINSQGLMPHEIVHKLLTKPNGLWCGLQDNLLAEVMWNQMTEQGFSNEWGLEDCIVVADGSGSMLSTVSGNTSITAIEICNALAIYFANQLQGPFHNKAITFSEHPVFIDLDKGHTLKEKMEIMFSHNEVASTNIEAVFDMLLDMAVSHEVPAEEMPKQLLIISDMEFNEATHPSVWQCQMYGKSSRAPFSQRLFDIIEQRYQEAGYQIPRLIFWNVCGRTDTIPKVEGENGICLLSGFSQNVMKVASHRDVKDPYECLLKTLDSPRYDKVEEALKGVA